MGLYDELRAIGQHIGTRYNKQTLDFPHHLKKITTSNLDIASNGWVGWFISNYTGAFAAAGYTGEQKKWLYVIATEWLRLGIVTIIGDTTLPQHSSLAAWEPPLGSPFDISRGHQMWDDYWAFERVGPIP